MRILYSRRFFRETVWANILVYSDVHTDIPDSMDALLTIRFNLQ